MYTFTKNIAKLIIHSIGSVEVKNDHLLPKDQGYVVTCPHTGWLEIVILGIVLPRPVHFMAKKELFENKLIGYFLHKINAFPVDRSNPSPSSIKIPVKLLKNREVVGIFPNGTRASEGTPMKRGAVTIANLAKQPIVPAYYEGPKTLKDFWKVKKATIIFGEPMYIKVEKKEQLTEYTERLNEITSSLGRSLVKN